MREMQRREAARLHEPRSGGVPHMVSCRDSRRRVPIDPVPDHGGRIATRNAGRLPDHVSTRTLAVAWISATHPHADHLFPAGCLAGRTGAFTATRSRLVARCWWKRIHHPAAAFPDRRHAVEPPLEDGNERRLAALRLRAMPGPGACRACRPA